MDGLAIWVVCRNPADFPGKFTCRRQWPTKGGIYVDPEVMVRDGLVSIRRRMIRMGLYRMLPETDDNPIIVETWI